MLFVFFINFKSPLIIFLFLFIKFFKECVLKNLYEFPFFIISEYSWNFLNSQIRFSGKFREIRKLVFLINIFRLIYNSFKFFYRKPVVN